MFKKISSKLGEAFYYVLFDKIAFPIIDAAFNCGTKNLENVVDGSSEPISEIHLGQILPSDVIYDMSRSCSQRAYKN